MITSCKKFLNHITSFSAGIGVTYLFLQLFPEFVERAIETFHPLLFLSVLGGFSLFFLAEKYVYQHYENVALAKGLELEDSAISFIYHFVVGILLVGLFLKDITEGFLFFFLVFMNTAVHVLPLDISPSKWFRAWVSSATVLGAVLALFITLTTIWATILTGFILGTLTFSVIRHSLPTGKLGYPSFFILGILFYCLLIFSKWYTQGYTFF